MRPIRVRFDLRPSPAAVISLLDRWKDAMTETADWQPSAAYLYVLHLKGSGLAWEFLRRNPHYRADWSRAVHGTADVAHWGLSFPGKPDA